MNAHESKCLCTGARVYWRGDAADGGTITGTNWSAVTIVWANGHNAPPKGANVTFLGR